MLIPDYKCQLCTFTCSCFSEYRMHMTCIHTFKGPPFQCDICHHSEKSLVNLMDHRIFHFDVRPYKCDFCCFQSKNKYALKFHEVNHYSSKAPHKCPYCKIEYGTILLLKRHLPKHKKKDSFVCHQCDCTTKNKVTKQTVKARRTKRQTALVEDTLHECAICDRYFPCKSSLRDHKCTHFPEIFFKCAICDYSCSLAFSIRTHYRKKHSRTRFVPIQREMNDCEDFIRGESYHIIRSKPSSKDNTTMAKSQTVKEILQQLSDHNNPDSSTSVQSEDNDHENIFQDGLVESSFADVVTSNEVENQQFAAGNDESSSVNDIEASNVKVMCNFTFNTETSQCCSNIENHNCNNEIYQPSSLIVINSPHLFTDHNNETNQSESIQLVATSIRESNKEPSDHISAINDDELGTCTNASVQYQSTEKSYPSAFHQHTESNNILQYQVPQTSVGDYVPQTLIENSCDPQLPGYFEINNNVLHCSQGNFDQGHLENTVNILKQNQEKDKLKEQQTLFDQNFLCASNPNAYQTLFIDEPKNKFFMQYNPTTEQNLQPLNSSNMQQVSFNNSSQPVFQECLESNANTLQYSLKEKNFLLQPEQYIRLETNVNGNNIIPHILVQNSSVPIEAPGYLERISVPHFITGNNPPVLQGRPFSLNTVLYPTPVLINQPKVLHSQANISDRFSTDDPIGYKSYQNSSSNDQIVGSECNHSVEIIDPLLTTFNDVKPKQNMETQTDFTVDNEH